MNTVIARIALLAQLLPMLSAFIQQVEGMFPQQGAGAAKLEAVRQMLLAAFADVQGLTTTFEQVWPLLQGAIGALVTLANSLHVFGHAGTPPAAPVAPPTSVLPPVAS